MFCRGQLPERGDLPSDIPKSPSIVYAQNGWKGYGDWLGTGTIAPRDIVFRPFEEARAFARSLELKSGDDWHKFCRGQLPENGLRPADIPANPRQAYAKSGWLGMGDWLGTGTIATRETVYRPFEEARDFVRALKLKSRSEWEMFCRGQLPERGDLPSDIPKTPRIVYAQNGWKGYGDWLGTGTIAPRLIVYRPFEEARAFVHALKLKNESEWRKFCKGHFPHKGTLPDDIPANPNQTYAKSGWSGMGDWLGTGTVAPSKKKFRSFEEARAFVHSLKLKNYLEWINYCKGQMPEKGVRPSDIPAGPRESYAKEGWKGYGDWLGTGIIAPCLRVYLPFENARAFTRLLKLKSSNEWIRFTKGQMPEKGMLPKDIPAKPREKYAKMGWKGMRDWLGTE
jgi:hypothetical protein